MRQIGLIAIIAFIFFLIEFSLFNFFGSWLRPNLMILLIIFFTLYTGIRYGLVAAILGGLLRDSFGIGIFGLHMFSFTVCAYLTVIIKKYLYQVETGFLRTYLAFIITILNILIIYGMLSMISPVNFYQMVVRIMIPETLATTLISIFVFNKLNQCVLKLSV